ncbi:MAG TPA: S41 family peptidase [Kofleriaceae bacterium]|jgi:hypothetical protein|nr:S41 family peptidase [Kofleriaceae bacterium]
MTLQQAHYDLYARAPHHDYDALYAAMRGRITEPEPALEVATRFQRFVAFGKVAHARIDATYDAFDHYLAGGGSAFPLLIRVVGDRVFITENRSGLPAIERGDELVALDGQPVEHWLARLARNQSADTPYLAHALMERDFPMLLWIELGRVDRFAISARRAGGAPFDVTLPACTDAEMRVAARTQPPVLALDRNARIAHMVGSGLAYLRPGPFYNVDPGATNEYDNTAFRRFIDGAFDRFLAAGASALVIDLRDNPGGDSSFSDLMVGWFADRPFTFESSFQIRVSAQAIASNQKRVELAPDDAHSVSRRFAAAYAGARLGDTIAFAVSAAAPHPAPRFTGKVYVLINRHSFSNTVAVAALVQDYGFGTVLGEETADLATTYGAMETFTLSHSGLEVGFPKAYIVRPNGDLAPRGVVPDLAIETPVVESIDDPVLQQALAIAARRP